jgi:hypothetical protein
VQSAFFRFTGWKAINEDKTDRTKRKSWNIMTRSLVFLQKCALGKALDSAMLDREEPDLDLSFTHLFSKEETDLELERGGSWR